MNKAVFLDRDGTLNEEIGYLHRVEDFRWLPGAVDAVRALKQTGWAIVVITNQAGVGRGYYTEREVAELHDHLGAELAQAGTGIDAIYYCPHHPDAGCQCRKPGTLLYERAARELDIDLSASFAVGDRLTDLIPARRLGCHTVLVQTGYGQAELARAEMEGFHVDHVAPNLGEASEWIISISSSAPGVPVDCAGQDQSSNARYALVNL